MLAVVLSEFFLCHIGEGVYTHLESLLWGTIVFLDPVICLREHLVATVQVTLRSVHFPVLSQKLHKRLCFLTLQVVSIEGNGFYWATFRQEKGGNEGSC